MLYGVTIFYAYMVKTLANHKNMHHSSGKLKLKHTETLGTACIFLSPRDSGEGI